MIIKYLFLDTECGGLSENTSLLTLGTIITDERFNVISEYEWAIKPDDGIYIVTAEAMAINKIDLISHDKVARPYKEVATALYDYLISWKTCNRYIPVGKNLAFDLARIYKYLLRKQTWEQLVSYQPFELNGAWRLLEAQKKVPILEHTSLSDLANHFNIEIKNLHTANGDNKLYIEILKRMVQL